MSLTDITAVKIAEDSWMIIKPGSFLIIGSPWGPSDDLTWFQVISHDDTRYIGGPLSSIVAVHW